MRTAPDVDAPPVTYEQFLAWPETNLPTEFVDGHALMTPSPTGEHQLAVIRLAHILKGALPHGLEVLPGPLDWLLRREPLLVRQPDLAVVTVEQVRSIPLEQPPLLAVEILSPTSHERDLVAKRAEYAAAGLDWYWIVDPARPQVLVLRRDADRFVTAAKATGAELLRIREPVTVALRPTDLT
jgi:Uma2 family endonuclease